MGYRFPFILLAVLGIAVTTAGASWSDFAPRPVQNGAFIDLLATYESDDTQSGIRPITWSDSFFRERLTLFSNGYVYDPRFLQYHLSIAPALKQEYYTASYDANSPGWSNGTGFEYDARFYLLPEHSYTLDLYAARYEPLTRQLAATASTGVEALWGGLFRYRQNPWFFDARYSDTTNTQDIASSNVKRFGVNGEYFKRFVNGNQLNFSAAYNPTRFSNSLGLTGDSTESALGNLIDLKWFRLNSSVTSGTYDQENATSRKYSNDQDVWYELLTAYLPYNFTVDASYRYQGNDNTISGPIDSQNVTFNDTNKIFEFDLEWKLYQSLQTTYTYINTSRTSTAGESTYVSNSLNVTYDKLVPNGWFQASLSLGDGTSTNQGQTSVVGEQHPATPVPGTFTLGQQYVDGPSIELFLKSPLTPYEVIQLVRNVNYTVTALRNTFEITVITLPPIFAVPGNYNFLVTYSLTTGDYSLGQKVTGFNTSVQLFNNLVTPYYTYTSVRSDVLSGVFPGIPLDSTTNTVGVNFTKGPLRAYIQYQDLQWDVSPYQSWGGQIQFSGPLDETTNLIASTTYLHKYFPQGTSSDVDQPYTDDSLMASARIQKELLDRTLTFSAGGSASLMNGLTDSSAYTLNAAVIWKVGKLELTGGASAYWTESQGTAIQTATRSHQYYYVNLRRFLF